MELDDNSKINLDSKLNENALLTASPDGRIEVKELLAEDGGDSLDKVL